MTEETFKTHLLFTGVRFAGTPVAVHVEIETPEDTYYICNEGFLDALKEKLPKVDVLLRQLTINNLTHDYDFDAEAITGMIGVLMNGNEVKKPITEISQLNDYYDFCNSHNINEDDRFKLIRIFNKHSVSIKF